MEPRAEADLGGDDAVSDEEVVDDIARVDCTPSLYICAVVAYKVKS